jgi:uncharacterized protein DUF6062
MDEFVIEGKTPRGKFIGYSRLIDACAQPGCPVCRCLASESRRYLEGLLHERVTDLDTRRAIRRSWGFCHGHTSMLADTAGSAFGAAIIYEDLVRRILRRTQEPRRSGSGGWRVALQRRRWRAALVDLWTRRATCPACADATTSERGYLETLSTFIDDDALRAAYEFSDGLCVPHLVRAIERGNERTDTLVARTREAWARIGRDLTTFVSKHDHRNREPYTEGEAAACARAFEMLAGSRSTLPSSR